MMKNHKTTTQNVLGLLKKILGIFLFLSSLPSAQAQQELLSKTQLADSSLAKAFKTYDLAIARNSFLFTGRNYNNKYKSIQGHQFFIEDYWEEGDICYKGQQFDSVYLLYEIFSDVVLVESFTMKGSMAPLKLHAPDVSRFNLFGHTFVRLESDSTGGIVSGFYDLLFDGDSVTLYAKREKEIVKSNDISTVAETFIQKDKYFIMKGGKYHQVRKKGSFFKVLGDRKKELKRFARTNMLTFSQNRERSLIAMTKYYDSLQ
jgi:hypothetical protein